MNMEKTVGVYMATSDSHERVDATLAASLSLQTHKPQATTLVVHGRPVQKYRPFKNLETKYSNIGLQLRFVGHALPSGSARQLALQALQTSHATGLNAGDLMLPDRIRNFLRFVDYRGDKAVFCSNRIVETRRRSRKVRGPSLVTLSHLAHENCVGSQVFGPTALLQETGYRDLDELEDHDFFIRLVAAHGPLVNTCMFDYAQVLSERGSDLKGARAQAYRKTYEALAKEYLSRYGPAFAQFAQNRFLHPGVTPSWSDAFSTSFIRSGALKYARSRIG